MSLNFSLWSAVGYISLINIFRRETLRSRVIRSILCRFGKLGDHKNEPTAGTDCQIAISPAKVSTPVDKFYSRFINKNLTAFNSFALQSRSLFIRDFFARGASLGRHDARSL